LSYAISLVTKKPIIRGYPPIVMIEPTDICNLKCPLCPSGNGTLSRKKGFMDFELFRKVIDEIHTKSMMLLLWNQGEPFLNNDFIKMTRYASEKGLYVLVSTNGNININPKDIATSGIDTLIFSIDGITQESYAQYRVGGNLSVVLKNMKEIIDAKDKYPLIEWQFLVFKHNENQIDSVKEKAKELGVDMLKFKTAQIYTANDIKFLPRNPRYRRYNVEGYDFKIKFELKNRCRRIWTQPVVNWNGEMAVCCFDKNNDYKVGNVKDEPLINIWKGKNFNLMREKIITNRKSIPMCRNCGEGVKLKFTQKS